MDASWVALAVGLGIVFFLIKSRWNYVRLPELVLRDQAPRGGIAVVIPARDEEANIGRAVHSFKGIPVFVVDDGSRDRTADVARQAGATVIPAPPLRAGLPGKPNACLAGAQASNSAWILFADADTCYQPDFVPSLLAYARAENLQAVSVFLAQERVTLWERLLLPYALALSFCGVSARRVNNPKSPEVLANGQCFLFERGAYEFCGGHGAVATSVVADVALARIVKRHKMRSRVVRAERLGSSRMYGGFGAIWRGGERSFFRSLLVDPGSAVQVVAASLLLTAYLPVLVWLLLDEQWWPALLFAVVPGLALVPWYGSILGAISAPLAIYIFQLVLVNAMLSVLFGKKVLWKGRRV